MPASPITSMDWPVPHGVTASMAVTPVTSPVLMTLSSFCRGGAPNARPRAAPASAAEPSSGAPKQSRTAPVAAPVGTSSRSPSATAARAPSAGPASPGSGSTTMRGDRASTTTHRLSGAPPAAAENVRMSPLATVSAEPSCDCTMAAMPGAAGAWHTAPTTRLSGTSAGTAASDANRRVGWAPARPGPADGPPR